ncbi:MAG TPA: archease [Candidatus Altiarchaeales archaeon]|nr:archease [Candidatus Altiarchaeales archaeon]
MPYEFLEHTADLKFRANGKNLEEALTESCRALAHAVYGGKTVKPKSKRILEIPYSNRQELVHDLLDQFLFIIEYEDYIPSEIKVKIDDADGKAVVELLGDSVEENNIKIEKEVKAVTYHEMKIEEKDGECTIQVICDT